MSILLPYFIKYIFPKDATYTPVQLICDFFLLYYTFLGCCDLYSKSEKYGTPTNCFW